MKRYMVVVLALMLSITSLGFADTIIDPDLDGSGCGDVFHYKGYLDRAIAVCGYGTYDAEQMSLKIRKCEESHLMSPAHTTGYFSKGANHFDRRYKEVGLSACSEIIVNYTIKE